MATGDVQDLLTRYAGELGPTEISRLTGDRVAAQGVDKYRKGQARFARLPSDDTIMGLTDALGFADDMTVLRAFAISGGRLRISPEPLLVAELPRGIDALDRHPDLVAAETHRLGMLARVLRELHEAADRGARKR